MDTEIAVALVAGVPATIFGVLAYRRSVQVDRLAAQSGALTETRAGTSQIIDAQNSIIDTLQEDNTSLRAELKYVIGRLDAMTDECGQLRVKYTKLYAKFGEENGV